MITPAFCKYPNHEAGNDCDEDVYEHLLNAIIPNARSAIAQLRRAVWRAARRDAHVRIDQTNKVVELPIAEPVAKAEPGSVTEINQQNAFPFAGFAPKNDVVVYDFVKRELTKR